MALRVIRGRVRQFESGAAKWTRVWPALLAIIFMSSCAPLGPRGIKAERTNYNLAIQQTQDQQLLLNLVRLKYRDTPVFLELGGITSQLIFEGTVEGGVDLQSPADLLRLGAGGTFTTQPTVTYTPLQGETFAQRLLSPLRLETLMPLYRSGWSLKRVLRVGVQKLNRVENAVRASGPTPERAPEYETFARVVDLMGDLNQAGQLDLVYQAPAQPSQPATIEMHIARSALGLPALKELRSLLNLAEDRTTYPVTYQLVEEPGEQPLDHLEVETRSLLGVLFFLSQAVEVPETDRRAGKVTITRTPAGERFDWKQITGNLLQVRSNPRHPDEAAIAVSYRGSWFFLHDSDLGSKSTFSLLAQLLALQSGKVEPIIPVLTLPVGR